MFGYLREYEYGGLAVREQHQPFGAVQVRPHVVRHGERLPTVL